MPVDPSTAMANDRTIIGKERKTLGIIIQVSMPHLATNMSSPRFSIKEYFPVTD